MWAIGYTLGNLERRAPRDLFRSNPRITRNYLLHNTDQSANMQLSITRVSRADPAKEIKMATARVIARIFGESDGRYYVCSDSLDHLDARSLGYLTKAAAIRAAATMGYTHATGSGTYWDGTRAIKQWGPRKLINLADSVMEQADRQRGGGTRFRVVADITYLDGNLEGLMIPGGYAVTFETHRDALSAWRWATTAQREGDFTRAAVTGNRYQFSGAIRLDTFESAS